MWRQKTASLIIRLEELHLLAQLSYDSMYAVCGTWYAVRGMRYAVCGMRHAAGGMRYTVCGMQYANVDAGYHSCFKFVKKPQSSCLTL